jgi:hypothetical protein
MKKFLFLFGFLIVSCNGKKEEKVFVKTKIDSTKLQHWGKGYYKNIIYYNFIYQKKNYDKAYKGDKLFRAGNYYFKKGDSIIVSFPKSKPKESKVLKKIFY